MLNTISGLGNEWLSSEAVLCHAALIRGNEPGRKYRAWLKAV